MRKRLNRRHHNTRAELAQALRTLELRWHAAVAGHALGRRSDDEVEAAKTANDIAKAEMHQKYLDDQFDLHANQGKRSSSHSFRKPKTMKVPIQQAKVGANTVTDPTAVAACFTEHWKAIMTAPPPEQAPSRATRRAALRYLDKKLTAEQRAELDRPLAAADLCGALKTMNPQKSPGPDRFSAGFFQVAPEIFSEILLLHETTIVGSSACATFLDFRKAYDKVDQTFLFEAMDMMNIGEGFIGWAQLLYKAQVVRLMLGDGLGPRIKPSRGVKQGCPLSCLLFVISIESLGQMLRAAPELGISQSDDTALTTSGAELNLSKCVTILLDETPPDEEDQQEAHALPAALVRLAASGPAAHANPDDELDPDYNSAAESDTGVASAAAAQALANGVAEIDTNAAAAQEAAQDVDQGERDQDIQDVREQPGAPAAESLLNIAPAGTPVRFLGVYVGTRIDPTYQVQLISDWYYASFQHWGYRARTLRGRRLLASSVMTSLLWHVTAAAAIPHKTVTAWQTMLTRYVLGRKRDPTEPYQSLLHVSWHHNAALGAGVPHIASAIRTQRLLTQQRLMLPAAVGALVLEQFAACMGFLHHDSHPFDFLFYLPHWGTKWITTSMLHPFWFDVWRHWPKTPWAKRLAAPPTYAMVTNMPVWLTTYEPMAVDGIFG
ncbi:hypothetical protein DYB32_009101 [Aphanomyces invadans]|uniref:Reverse transcriptase domain-containing protein n=1 Tax=Aphanomyces invadans TaxID=157072 RepID=A0A418AJ87_9STRA|nr:hypothetical protein DYB32_009101 [Aphanomyces invadans]